VSSRNSGHTQSPRPSETATSEKDVQCPLCSSRQCTGSWHGSIFWAGKEFPYLECDSCGSLFCSPMPDGDVLAKMYGRGCAAEYECERTDLCCGDAERVLDILRRVEGRTFVDYGCGSGLLLAEVTRLGWRSMGIEWDSEIARKISISTGVTVVGSRDAERWSGEIADVLHLGDVIEHLTDVDEQMPRILRLLKPSGLLIAQGPLQANFTIFNAVVKMCRPLMRRLRRTEISPEHVLLATAVGQRAFFARFGFAETVFDIWETNWPAPNKLVLRDLIRPRNVVLYSLAILSRCASQLRQGTWGNRYFFCGRRTLP
jgi:trans-aconitate methyltransferase